MRGCTSDTSGVGVTGLKRVQTQAQMILNALGLAVRRVEHQTSCVHERLQEGVLQVVRAVAKVSSVNVPVRMRHRQIGLQLICL